MNWENTFEWVVDLRDVLQVIVIRLKIECFLFLSGRCNIYVCMLPLLRFEPLYPNKLQEEFKKDISDKFKIAIRYLKNIFSYKQIL